MRTPLPRRRKSLWVDFLIYAAIGVILIVMAFHPVWSPFFPGLPPSPVSR